MEEKYQQIIVKLVLFPLNFIHEDFELQSDEYNRIHDHLVAKFRRAFGSLILDLELLGHEVIKEFYCDTLIGRDYELSVGRDDQDAVRDLVE